MGLLLCAKKAKNPYVLPDKKIYSIEELCYYIYNNPYMINITFFTRELIDFIENELSMVSLAQKLKRGIDYGENIVDLVMHIFDASNYYTTAQTQAYVTGYTYDKATIDQKIGEGGAFDPTQYYTTAQTYSKTEVDGMWAWIEL